MFYSTLDNKIQQFRQYTRTIGAGTREILGEGEGLYKIVIDYNT